MTQNDAWIPQLFQDLITGDLARFSAMTVIDRSNEQMVLAEQGLSAGGNYSDNDYVRMGNLTNARYIVAGSINNVSGRYNVSFRVNNTETNEIRATFNKPYSVTDIESGLAAKEAVRELLAGMGIQLPLRVKGRCLQSSRWRQGRPPSLQGGWRLKGAEMLWKPFHFSSLQTALTEI